MRKFVKRALWYITFLMVFTMLIAGKEAKAADTAWYLDYDYELQEKSEYCDDNYIIIHEYKKTASSLYVPAATVIDGVTYHTKLFPNGKSIWDGTKDSLKKLTFGNGCKVSGGSFLFCGLSKLTTINTEALDMSEADLTAWMFAGCESLTKLNVANWDMSNVENMFNMFGGCEKLASIDVSKWDTSKVRIMISVFDHCKSLYKINVSNWDVSNVTMMDSMFYKCEKLNSLDLHKWNTSNVTTMWEMFGRCYSLRKINLKGWDTSNVTSMAGMFCCNYNLESLDLSSFDMSKVKFKKHDDQMFLRCGSLKTIKTPKKTKQKLYFNSGLTYAKKTGGRLGTVVYNYIPKTKKSITMVCLQSKSSTTQITSIQSSGKKIKLSWNPVNTSGRFNPVQYEVQCSTNKKFSDAVGTMTNMTDATYSVQDNVTNATSTTIKGLTKGKTYYVRVRVYTYEKLLSKWSKVRKIKVK